jgi:cytochrome c-type biogenesis protein CcmH
MVSAAFVALALLLALAVFAAVLWPLRRQSRGLALSLGGAGMALVAVLYLLDGTPAALQAGNAAAPASLDEAIARLEHALADNPDQAEGWALLGRAYAGSNRLADAARAYAKAAGLAPGEPDLLVEAAQARADIDPQHRFDAQATGWLDQALKLQPEHQRAAGLPASPAASRAIRPKPRSCGRRCCPMWMPPPPPACARRSTLPARMRACRPCLRPSARALLKLHVELAPELQSQLRPGAVLFVFVRQAEGAPMPVAAKRLPATAFPVDVELSDDDSPMPTLHLSQVGHAGVQARISLSGRPEAAPAISNPP